VAAQVALLGELLGRQRDLTRRKLPVIFEEASRMSLSDMVVVFGWFEPGDHHNPPSGPFAH
jgi:hypothetical protein